MQGNGLNMQHGLSSSQQNRPQWLIQDWNSLIVKWVKDIIEMLKN